MQNVLTTCTYCGCGCGLYLQVEDNRVIGSLASYHHPVSRNNLCVKGWQLHEMINHPDRLTRPLMRKNGKLAPVSWEEALAFTAEKLKKTMTNHGSDAIGVLSSAKCTNEENYLLQKFTRAVLKTNNIDHCARL